MICHAIFMKKMAYLLGGWQSNGITLYLKNENIRYIYHYVITRLMNKFAKPTRIAVISLWAEDVTATAHFYKDLLGLDLLPHHHGGHPHFKIGDSFLAILKGKPHLATETTIERFPLVAFTVKDLDKAVGHLEANNVEMPWGMEHDETARWVMFYDPAGNLIELVEFNHD
jgi:catechol 2,3-dioxygenase-like lactoylglutathione lyase family enzyme